MNDFSYIGVAKCGCVPALALDDGSADVGKVVAKWIAMGRTVERVVHDEAARRWTTECPHTPKWGRAA